MQQTLSQWPKGKATSRLRAAVKIRNHLQFARESLRPLKQILEYSHQTNPTSLSQALPYVKSSHPESCILPFLLPLLSLLIRLLCLTVSLKKKREKVVPRQSAVYWSRSGRSPQSTEKSQCGAAH